ncbi:threonyl-tRNA synthetase [Marinospirillum celere]|uniref:Threonine--tRNA ligase n=1 Tax=Marinospirillum celere TaxID=1122252 RepID=A0A1I1EN29_9GAMM|nr:threonine--tRNA ligase [Marinospirillum celere]SFB88511.1 threonyl-tRNA synthetase [Marinospirillum celere]
MPVITLPDGSQRSFDHPVTVHQVAESIGSGLAKAALGGKVNGELVDTSYTLTDDSELAIVTPRDDDGLEILRHSCAHLMAQAVKKLFPEAQVTIGPTIEDGFYYDFDVPEAFTPEDLEAIEKEMNRLAKADIPVERFVMSREEAIPYFEEQGEIYKAEIIRDIPAKEELSLYKQDDFTDLCRGPHVPSTGKIKAFKLMRVSGAYWRGDSKNKMLQRIYGTCWADKKDLKAYLHRLEEAEKRDHRKLAKRMDLFHIQDEAPGMVFWHANGWTLYQTLETYMRGILRNNGYQEVRTPQVVDRVLWEKSGHWEHYQSNMFTTVSEHRDYAIKPMNCPCHLQIFNQGLKSYRDLPLRMAEFGSCHRNEPSGSLHGLMRVRGFTQDDAHIFCTEEQMEEEAARFIQLTLDVYKDFGFEDVELKLSTRPESRIGADELWDKAEHALEHALNKIGKTWDLQPGEGAFYGPKIEFSLRDCLGRVWQCGTLQLDFVLPSRLGSNFVSEDGSRKPPVMLHRAILGSFERFIGILIEHYAGDLPPWLAPVQAVVLNITDKQAPYVKEIAQKLHACGVRVETDLRNEKIGFKIREHTLAKVPYLLVVGDKEVESGTVALRTRHGEDLGTYDLADLQAKLLERNQGSSLH